MIRAPASTRCSISCAIGCATAQKSRSSPTPGGRNLQFTMVTGPVSIPFTGFAVAAWARRHSSTVIDSEMVGGAARIGGRVHRLPEERTHPGWVVRKLAEDVVE